MDEKTLEALQALGIKVTNETKYIDLLKVLKQHKNVLKAHDTILKGAAPGDGEDPKDPKQKPIEDEEDPEAKKDPEPKKDPEEEETKPPITTPNVGTPQPAAPNPKPVVPSTRQVPLTKEEKIKQAVMRRFSNT